MKKKVLYSLAALSALPGASYAETINVDANNSATLDQTASGSDATLANAVFTSGANYKLVINVANSLMPGKYLLKATADNGESNNNLTVSYTVGGGAAVNSGVDALAAGITIDVAKASKSKIVLTVEDTNEEKAAFTVAGLTLQLQFDFDQVYTMLSLQQYVPIKASTINSKLASTHWNSRLWSMLIMQAVQRVVRTTVPIARTSSTTCSQMVNTTTTVSTTWHFIRHTLLL